MSMLLEEGNCVKPSWRPSFVAYGNPSGRDGIEANGFENAESTRESTGLCPTSSRIAPPRMVNGQRFRIESGQSLND